MKNVILKWIAGIALSIPFFCYLEAVENNHYVLGSNGLNSTVKPVQGFVYTNLFDYYRANQLVGNRGQDLRIRGSFKKYLDLNVFEYYSGCEIFGAVYGAQAIIPFGNLSNEVGFLEFDLSSRSGKMLLSDIYIEPVNLIWRASQYNLLIAYGFFAPTGKYEPFSPENVGLGNWSQLFTLATTYFFDCERTWSISAYSCYEIHFKKRNTDIRPGDNFTVDWGVGKTFMDFLTIGLVGYYECQTTNDQGSEVPEFLKDLKDRVQAIGGEINGLIPEINGQVIFRYEHEIEVRNRTKGWKIIGAIAIIF